MFLSHYLGVYISEVSYWRPLTFQLGGDAMGNAPTFLLAIDMNLSQFQDFFAKMRLPPGLCPVPLWGAYSAPHTPSWKALDQAKMNPPFQNPGYGPVPLQITAKLYTHSQMGFVNYTKQLAKMYAISSDTHQLQFIKLNHFKQE